MKKLVALLLACMLILAAVAAIADEDVVGHDDEWCYRFQN